MKINQVITGIDKSKSFRVYLAVTTKLVQDAQDIHQASPLAIHALGRVLTAGGLMALLLKGQRDKLTVQFKGDGPAGEILCTAYADGRVKGYISNPDVELPPTKHGKPDVGGALGLGTLTVIKDLGLKEPYIGKIDFVTGEIADDLTAYYFISEQQPSSVALGVKLDENGRVAVSGGMIIQPLPDAQESALDALENWLERMPPFSEQLQKGLQNSLGKTEEAIMVDLLGTVFSGIEQEYDVLPLNHLKMGWECDCSKERSEQIILSLGAKEIKDIIDEDGEAELVCQFCCKKYQFDRDHLERLLAESLQTMIPKEIQF